jgi:hypothetical protein
MPATNDIDQIVQDILADMSLKEKAAIANLDEDKVPNMKHRFESSSYQFFLDLNNASILCAYKSSIQNGMLRMHFIGFYECISA